MLTILATILAAYLLIGLAVGNTGFLAAHFRSRAYGPAQVLNGLLLWPVAAGAVAVLIVLASVSILIDAVVLVVSKVRARFART